MLGSLRNCSASQVLDDDQVELVVGLKEKYKAYIDSEYDLLMISGNDFTG